jgi:hypothetical protein
MPTLPSVVFDVLRTFCPPVLQLVFIRSGRMPTLPSVVFLCIVGILPAGIATSFYSFGQDAHATIGGF